MNVETMTKERGILFSGPMVRALLAGTKTMTRRIVKPQPETTYPKAVFSFMEMDGSKGIWGSEGCGISVRKCLYGTVADCLWVRESFTLVPCSAGCEKYPEGFDPKCSSASQPNAPHEGVRYKATWDRSNSSRWKPSIHMPRWASRITLEITGVKVERVQDISEEDAVAEGVDAVSIADVPRNGCLNRRTDFMQLWNIINGKDSWKANQFVWVISFRRIRP